jgi:hypothetical protein
MKGINIWLCLFCKLYTFKFICINSNESYEKGINLDFPLTLYFKYYVIRKYIQVLSTMKNKFLSDV